MRENSLYSLDSQSASSGKERKVPWPFTRAATPTSNTATANDLIL